MNPVSGRGLGLLIAIASMAGLAFGSPAMAADIVCEAPVATSATPSSPATPAAIAEVAFPEDGGELTVFAAASLTDAFAEIVTNVEAANPGLDITVETGGSQSLVTQLQE